MKTQNQLECEVVKMVSDTLSITRNEKKIALSGFLGASKRLDDEIPDGYTLINAEYLHPIDEGGVRALAKSLGIKQLTIVKAIPEIIERLRVLLELSKAKVKDNNIFTAIETKNGCSQVVMFWKRR